MDGDASLLDGDRFLVVFSQFPQALATVVDLESRSVADTIPMTGCAGVYATGENAFATLCGDGTVVQHRLAPDGGLSSRIPSDRFFDVVEDRGELNNVLASQSQLVAEMRRHADAQEQKAKTNAQEGGEAKLSASEREALCQLGYMECD